MLANSREVRLGGNLKKEIFVQNGYAVYEQSHAIYSQFENIRYHIDKVKFEEMKGFQVVLVI